MGVKTISGHDGGPLTSVIPGRAKREPGIHHAAGDAVKWIPGLRLAAHPGMTEKMQHHLA
jgi:hypothetical protein